MKEKVGEG